MLGNPNGDHPISHISDLLGNRDASSDCVLGLDPWKDANRGCSVAHQKQPAPSFAPWLLREDLLHDDILLGF